MSYFKNIGQQANWMFEPLVRIGTALHQSGMLKKLKWGVLLIAIGSPFMAYSSWQKAVQLELINTRGIETVAVIKKFHIRENNRRNRKGEKQFSVDLMWKDREGQQKTKKDVTLSKRIAKKLLTKNHVVGFGLKIKYLHENQKPLLYVVGDYDSQMQSSSNKVIELSIVSSLFAFFCIGMMMFTERFR